MNSISCLIIILLICKNVTFIPYDNMKVFNKQLSYVKYWKIIIQKMRGIYCFYLNLGGGERWCEKGMVRPQTEEVKSAGGFP